MHKSWHTDDVLRKTAKLSKEFPIDSFSVGNYTVQTLRNASGGRLNDSCLPSNSSSGLEGVRAVFGSRTLLS